MSFTLLELQFLGKTMQWRKLDANVWKVLPNVKETLKTLEKKNEVSKTRWWRKLDTITCRKFTLSWKN